MRWAALALVALALTGCETTAERSARLERRAALAAAHAHAAQKAVTVGAASRYLRIVSATLLRSTEGAAALVTVRNRSAHALHAAPIAITVTDSAGRQLYTNLIAGSQAPLVSIASIAAHGELTWVDDQVPTNGSPVRVSARVGEAAPVRGALPPIAVSQLHLIEDPANGVEAAGTVTNRSSVAQSGLVVFVLGLRGGRPVAAGRAIVASLTAGASLPFQAFLIGDPRGAQLQASAPPSTLG